MKLKENLSRVLESIIDAQARAGLKHTVTIVAVTKTHPPKTIEAAVNTGLYQIGENRLQEAMGKFAALPPGLRVYKRMIGHLQSNKVNKALETFDSIDSVDSVKLAKKINRRSEVLNQTTPVLLEVNTSGEPQKSGFQPDQIEVMLTCLEMEHLKAEGLMTVGPLTRDENQIRQSFATLRRIFEQLNTGRSSTTDPLTTLSMGMSGDYTLAVEEGSTMIRLGTALFGPREK